jgi:hypothetical protein
MKGDFSRDTFNSTKHFLRVLMQQGRVELDANFNEQTAILLHYMQTLAADLIGPHGGPAANIGFGILPNATLITHLPQSEQDSLQDQQTLRQIDQLFTARNNKTIDFVITKGRYYVDGVLCENEDHVLYSAQPNYPGDDLATLRTNLLIYLDVWERTITYVEDDSIREVALGGADTAARTRVEWQVRVWPDREENRGSRTFNENEIKTNWPAWASFFQPANRGRLRICEKSPDGATASEPCIIHPDARYRGAENQLYRVEIHRSGLANHATFKWSRENGSVTFPILTITGGEARLAHLGRDTHLGLKVNDWVEVVDDRITLNSEAGPLFQVADIRPIDMLVTLKASAGGTVPQYQPADSARHPYLRRWDHKGNTEAGGAIIVIESNNTCIALEDNVEIQFPVQTEAHYRAGDYWLIPARTATGRVEWPRDAQDAPIAQPPQGVEHHYAPLAILEATDRIKDVRLVFPPIPKAS